MNAVQEFLNNTYVGVAPFVLATFGLLVVYKLVHDRVTAYDDDAMITGGTTAAGLSRAGGYIGVVLAMAGSLINSPNSYFADLGMFALDGVVAIFVFVMASFAIDWVLLPSIDNEIEISGGNTAVGLVEAAAYTALGIIMMASFSGSGTGLIEGLVSATVFSLLGLLMLGVTYMVYNWLMERNCQESPDLAIERGKLSAAVDSASVLLAMSFVLLASIAGDFTSWQTDLLSFFGAALIALVCVLVARFLAALLVPGGVRDSNVSITTGNVAIATIVGGVTLALASVSAFVIAS